MEGTHHKKKTHIAKNGNKLNSVFAAAEPYLAYKSLKDMPQDWFTVKSRDRPTGYAALTSVYVGGKKIEALLDYGATVSAVSEEMLLCFMEHSYHGVEGSSGFDPTKDPLYPIRGLERAERAATLTGVQSGSDREPMRAEYAVSLRVEFAAAGVDTGLPRDRTMDIYFKVIPKGETTYTGLILGLPTLDDGLQHIRLPQAHYFKALDLYCPRLELHRKSARARELKEWNKTGD